MYNNDWSKISSDYKDSGKLKEREDQSRTNMTLVDDFGFEINILMWDSCPYFYLGCIKLSEIFQHVKL